MMESRILDCEKKIDHLDARITQLLISQERCTSAIEQLTRDTGGVVDLYKTAENAVTIGVGAQKFALWITKWPLIGAGLYTVYKWFIDHLANIT